MIEINLYKIDNFQKVFTKLVEVIIAQNKRIFTLVTNEAEEEELDYLLWSYKQLSFIPHGTLKDPYPEEQKLLLGTKLFPGLDLLIITDHRKLIQEGYANYTKVLILERLNLESAKLYLKSLEEKTSYFEQDSEGKWLKETI